jgi:hypothetical protein
MSHQTDTLTQPIPMPRQTHLLRRGSRYYLNVKVPKDLRAVFKQPIIRKALNTSDPHEAARRVRFESLRVHADFENEQTKLRADTVLPKQLSAISTGDAYDLVFRYFKGLEEMSEHWWENKARKLNELELGDALDYLRIDEVALTGGNLLAREPQIRPSVRNPGLTPERFTNSAKKASHELIAHTAHSAVKTCAGNVAERSSFR